MRIIFMLTINKIRTTSPIDFAAEELKKYLRMMMPECGDIGISYAPEAKCGFRLGLMQDFGLDVSDAEDLFLDDILYIDCDCEGGIIAGSNERSILLSVYEYLRQNGCRWLLPGVDGEFIPMQDIVPVKYRYKPSCRCRSYCIEGAVSQKALLDIVDLSPKLGMNTYMLENRETTWSYNHFYEHIRNTENRTSERVTEKAWLGWRRAVEYEINKRGLVFHSVGHGFCSDPFKDDPEYLGYVAELNGKRQIHGGSPIYTNVCMSNPVVRRKIVDFAVNYSKNHSNVDYLHVWLADMSNNHCECKECKRRTPSDWYMILLNEMEEALTEAGLDTRLVFISYVDTMWAPETEKLNSPEKFTLLFAPITRSYDATLPALKEGFKTSPYERNKLTLPSTLTENLEYLKGWDRVYGGMRIAFEYHFWRHNVLEPTGIGLARRIVEDVKAYKENGIDGMIEDGTVRCFFPNGYALYAAARSMFDVSLSEKDIAKDYFPYLYGEDWERFYDILSELSDLFDTSFMEGRSTKAPEFSAYYDPEHAENIARIPASLDKLTELIEAHYNSDYRVRTVAVRLLEYFVEYARGLYPALYEKALGNEEEAQKKYKSFMVAFGAKEREIERYYDHFMAEGALGALFKPNNLNNKPIIV